LLAMQQVRIEMAAAEIAETRSGAAAASERAAIAKARALAASESGHR
jgi:hypothetical protein